MKKIRENLYYSKNIYTFALRKTTEAAENPIKSRLKHY